MFKPELTFTNTKTLFEKDMIDIYESDDEDDEKYPKKLIHNDNKARKYIKRMIEHACFIDKIDKINIYRNIKLFARCLIDDEDIYSDNIKQILHNVESEILHIIVNKYTNINVSVNDRYDNEINNKLIEKIVKKGVIELYKLIKYEYYRYGNCKLTKLVLSKVRRNKNKMYEYLEPLMVTILYNIFTKSSVPLNFEDIYSFVDGIV
jgi:hypothetical protein